MKSKIFGIRRRVLTFNHAMMNLKRRFFLFLIAAGLPVSISYTASSGCTGLCGNCQGTCLPSLAVLLLLGSKAGYVKLKQRIRKRGHHAESSC